MVDVASAFSVTTFAGLRAMDVVAKSFEVAWCNSYGPSSQESGDPEFGNKVFVNALNYLGIKFISQPARRHNKIRSVESENEELRLIIEKLLIDGKNSAEDHDVTIAHEEVLSRATYLRNILLGSRKLSSFEIVKGYAPALGGLPQRPVS